MVYALNNLQTTDDITRSGRFWDNFKYFVWLLVTNPWAVGAAVVLLGVSIWVAIKVWPRTGRRFCREDDDDDDGGKPAGGTRVSLDSGKQD